MKTESVFPAAVDELIFFQDIRLSDANKFTAYQTLLKNRRYAEATKYLHESNLSYYGAWLFNLFENRIYAVQRYFHEHPKTTHTILSDTEPVSAAENTVWLD